MVAIRVESWLLISAFVLSINWLFRFGVGCFSFGAVSGSAMDSWPGGWLPVGFQSWFNSSLLHIFQGFDGHSAEYDLHA